MHSERDIAFYFSVHIFLGHYEKGLFLLRVYLLDCTNNSLPIRYHILVTPLRATGHWQGD